MPYIHKYTKELEQFGLCSFKLELTDTDNIFPSLTIPVIQRVGEYTDESLHELAMRLILQETPAPVEETPTVTEEQPII